MQIITKVLVGSRLHGLHNEKSDYDYRGIHMNDLRDVLSPFKTPKNTSWIEGDIDNTSYELADFCKQAVHGNATILEVFFSNEVVETSPVADELRANWLKFMDTDRFVMASRGYAANQYNKMQLFESAGIKGQERTAKFAIAYCRVLWQCAEYLRTGVFPCQISDPELREFLLTIKPLTVKKLQPYIPRLVEMFMELQKAVTDAHKRALKTKPDIEWIEDFIYRSYTVAPATESRRGMNKDEQIYQLYKLIDDIDTATDIYKTDYNGFMKSTIARIKKRFDIVPNSQADKLYAKFYGPES